MVWGVGRSGDDGEGWREVLSVDDVDEPGFLVFPGPLCVALVRICSKVGRGFAFVEEPSWPFQEKHFR